MRSDLLYAKAALDWAKTNLPALEQRLNLWCEDNIQTVLIQADSNATHDVIIATEKSPFPLSLSVEAGAYINVIRSSLDILAWAVFQRDQPMLHPKEVYFPIARDEAAWRSGDYHGSKFIAQLGGTERGVFESLKPYGGENGNTLLYALHHFDITRKHKRLLDLAHAPRKLTLIGDFGRYEFIPVNTPDGFIPCGNGETILGLWDKHAAKPEIGYSPEVFISEPEIEFKGPVMPVLGAFARQAERVIAAFDY